MRQQGWLFVLAFFVYNLNLRPIPSGDTAPAALLPLSLLAGHTITFDRYAEWYRGTQHMHPAWFKRARDGHFYSSFPIALPLLITPLYAPLAAVFDIQQMPVERVVLLARILEKVSASLIAALSVVAFLALAGKLGDPKTAWLLTVVYAFASPTWSISSQALWQHGASELAFILGLLCLIHEAETPGHVLFPMLAGWCAGFSVALRLSNVVPCLLMSAYVGLSRWRVGRKVVFACCAVLPVMAALAYNVRVFGNISGTYPAGWLLQGNMLEGIGGLLISPSRGLLVFCPIFLFSAIGVFLWIRGPRNPHLGIYLIRLVAAAAHILALCTYRLWWGHRCDSLSRNPDVPRDAPGRGLTRVEIYFRRHPRVFDLRPRDRRLLLSQRPLGCATAVGRPAQGAPLGLARQPDHQECQGGSGAGAVPPRLDLRRTS